MTFQKESDFEEALIKILTTKGWESTILKYPTEQDLIRNWANILFDNNRGIDRLGDYPLTDGEMQQIVEQIRELRTPLKLNGFINGKTVSVKRDNPDDKAHFGKEVSLKIYDRMEIAAGQSRYQIVQQPIFPGKSKMLNDRRGDLMLLINGMPVFHLELKRSGVPVSQAYNQIEKYAHEGVFTGLFSLVQIFVAMNPEETVYFANPGPDGKFNTDYYFHWADFNNEPINDWKEISSKLLSIPMAHQLIGFYTVADDADGVLKVMRSYQYYAASAISDVVSKTKWDSGKQRGGYIWHTTGSGKTMTSFKSAQLIANSNDADKVVFLTDRIELGTQSLKEYRAFADENETVQATENTYVLISKLKSICFEYGLYYSPVSTPADFRSLAPIVLEQALKESGTQLLEPYLSFTLYAPREYLSRAYHDAPKYCATIETVQVKKDEVVFTGEIPARCIQAYRTDLAFYTNGQSVCLTELKGYQAAVGKPVIQPRRPNSLLDKVRYMFQKIM